MFAAVHVCVQFAVIIMLTLAVLSVVVCAVVFGVSGWSCVCYMRFTVVFCV